MKKYILPVVVVLAFGAVVFFGLKANSLQGDSGEDKSTSVIDSVKQKVAEISSAIGTSESGIGDVSTDKTQDQDNDNIYINFNESEVKEQEITKIIVHNSSDIADEIENNDAIESVKEIPETDSVAIAFKSTDDTDAFLESVDGKINNSQIEEDVEFTVAASFNDPYYSSQTNLTQMSMSSGWDYLYDASSITIAIIDTGIRGTHEDLTGKVTAGYNTLTSSSISANSNSDDNGHGTAMASAAASIGNNSVGLVGVAYDANVMPVKSFNSGGTGDSSNIATGIIWAANNGAQVINLSFGSDSYSETMHQAILYAKNNGCFVVAAAGNDGNALSYPGSDYLVLTAGSVNSSNARSGFSDYGSELDVMAPGESIITASYTGDSDYTSGTGTSVSAAETSGLVALAILWDSGSTTNERMQFIRDSAQEVSGMNGNDRTDYYGYGVINYNYLQTRVGDYHYSWVTQSGYPTISQDSSNRFTLTLRNTGESTWRKNSLNLGTSRGRDRISGFIRESTDGSPSGWIAYNRIAMNETTVAPGNNATFTFYMKTPSGMGSGTYREYFQPVMDGIQWLDDYGIYWDITVPQPTPAYSYSWTTQNGYPTLNKGEAYKFSVTVTNNGTQTWQKNQVNLGTSRGKDRISGFIRESTDGSASGWISGNRIQFKESSVAPGATATYEFYMKVPTDFNSGTYREYFQVVADGIGWLQDYGIYWDVSVR